MAKSSVLAASKQRRRLSEPCRLLAATNRIHRAMNGPQLLTREPNLDLFWTEARGQKLAAVGKPALGCGKLGQLGVGTAPIKGYNSQTAYQPDNRLQLQAVIGCQLANHPEAPTGLAS
jgi:hypothetical protein